jgi:hypothetical protein
MGKAIAALLPSFFLEHLTQQSRNKTIKLNISKALLPLLDTAPKILRSVRVAWRQ